MKLFNISKRSERKVKRLKTIDDELYKIMLEVHLLGLKIDSLGKESLKEIES